MLIRLAGVLNQDLFGSGAVLADALPTRDLGRFLEEDQGPDEVDRAAPEMERARAPTNSAVAARRASTATECEARKLSQEQDCMHPSVRTQPCQNADFSLGPSAQMLGHSDYLR